MFEKQIQSDPPKCYPSKCNTSLNARLFLGPTNITSIDFYLPKCNTSLNARVRAGPDDVHLGRSDCIQKFINHIPNGKPKGSVVHGTILDNFGHFFKLKLLEILLR